MLFKFKFNFEDIFLRFIEYSLYSLVLYLVYALISTVYYRSISDTWFREEQQKGIVNYINKDYYSNDPFKNRDKTKVITVLSVEGNYVQYRENGTDKSEHINTFRSKNVPFDPKTSRLIKHKEPFIYTPFF